MEEKINQILQKLYNDSDEIAWIAYSGSAVLPWIKNPDDYDIFVVADYCESFKQFVLGMKPYYKDILKEQYDHYPALQPCEANLYRFYLDKDFDQSSIRTKIKKYDLPVYAYEFKYMQIVYGTDIVGITKLDILQQKNRMINTLKNAISAAEGKKWFYHVLTTLYILQNNSYDLTPEQIENINIAHDKKDTATIAQLYQWAVTEIEKL